YYAAGRRYLHAFPTRRSSDLGGDVGDEDRRVHRELDAEVGEVDLQRRGAVVLVPLEGDGAGEAQHREVGGDLGDRETEGAALGRSEEHTSELQSRENLVCRLL